MCTENFNTGPRFHNGLRNRQLQSFQSRSSPFNQRLRRTPQITIPNDKIIPLGISCPITVSFEAIQTRDALTAEMQNVERGIALTFVPPDKSLDHMKSEDVPADTILGGWVPGKRVWGGWCCGRQPHSLEFPTLFNTIQVLRMQ